MKFIKKQIKYIFRKCKSFIVNKKITERYFCVADLFFNQFNSLGQYNRYDIIVRYMAIENYYGINETGFELYEKMQNKRIGREIERTKNFKELIQSYENGYNDISKIDLNATLKLLDGSHRMALHIYNGIKYIHGRCKNLEKKDPDYSMDWFFANGFTFDEISQIQDKYQEICKKLNGGGLTGIVWSPVEAYFNDIINEMSLFGEVFDINTISFNNDYEFEAVVKGIYHPDDIADWKIKKKLDFMKSYNKTMLVMKIRTDNPYFRIKSSSGLPLSRYVERIKKGFRERYKGFIPNYFHDVIIHIADNYEQSVFIDKLLKINLDVSAFFNSISDMEYVISKIETPYMHREFPNKAPLHKDADILCSKDSFEEIVEAALGFSRCFDNEIEVKINSLTNQTLIRLELYGFMIYQFDISKVLSEFTPSFIDLSVKNRKPYNGCFITDEKCEYLIRLSDYKRHPQKAHHLSYLQEHKEDFDTGLFTAYLLHPKNYIELLNSLDINYAQ